MNNKLTASEKGYLWTTFMVDSMAVCCLKYFLDKCEDNEIKDIITFALELSIQHMDSVKEIFTKENHPIPIGFTAVNFLRNI
ncbi:putative membrane protein YiaA [Evansella vedderi]|uniref:Membrane protein YiaA n=1 Tax=Evansella vedderi TaxID=38282 RepID=A0ABT9ZX59_9BACI|nr:DUF3231 family protein [Evansella vedderi]MDQ0255812.1 putative membrane protein YiaA [Evansella vedderi]